MLSATGKSRPSSPFLTVLLAGCFWFYYGETGNVNGLFFGVFGKASFLAWLDPQAGRSCTANFVEFRLPSKLWLHFDPLLTLLSSTWMLGSLVLFDFDEAEAVVRLDCLEPVAELILCFLSEKKFEFLSAPAITGIGGLVAVSLIPFPLKTGI